jgi:KDO2-lipid IV(A) lauroyltransferase
MSTSSSSAEKRAGTDSALGAGAPKRKTRNPATDRAAYAAARLVFLLLNTLPEHTARTLGRSMGCLIWKISKRYRKQIVKHMDIAFRDEFTQEQKQAWCKANFEHIGLSLVEFARMNKITPATLENYVDLSEVKVITDLVAEQNGKGVLCIPAHHGNWELSGYTVAMKGLPLKSVARPLDNPQLNEFITGLREASGNEIIEKWQVLWKLKKLLDKGGIVTMSVDQNGGVAGHFVPLFGALASTVASPAELHLASKVPIVVVSFNRQPDGVRHKFHVWDVIHHQKTADHTADVRTVLTRVNQAYEKAIRAYPEQWLWVHKRWKTRPPGEVAGPDGLPPKV